MHPYKVVREITLIDEHRVGIGVNQLPTTLAIGQAPNKLWGYQIYTTSGVVSEAYNLKDITITVKGTR
jgi:hypothetical protein